MTRQVIATGALRGDVVGPYRTGSVRFRCGRCGRQFYTMFVQGANLAFRRWLSIHDDCDGAHSQMS